MVVVVDEVGPEHESTGTTPYGLDSQAAVSGVVAPSGALGVRTVHPARIPRDNGFQKLGEDLAELVVMRL